MGMQTETFAASEDRPHNVPDSFHLDLHGNRFDFFPKGTDRLRALIDQIASAQESLHCFWFLYDEDETGAKVRDALIEAARRGVEVRLYIDAFGSDARDEFFDDLCAAGGHFQKFSPSWNVKFLIRNHQKMCIVDRKRVLTGGFNVADDYFASPDRNGWCDLGVLVEGPLVDRFNEWYDAITEWIETGGSEFRAVRQLVRDWEPGDGPIQLIMGGPTTVSSEWSVRFKRDLVKAKRADLVTAYFSPPFSMRRVLRRAGRRGKLRMILASKSDFAITVLAARLHYRRFVRAGVKLFEYQPSKLHMKLLVMDDVTYIGSANLDLRSIRLNLELMIRIESAELADRMRALIDDLEADSRPIDKSWFGQYGKWSNRMRWFVSSFMLRFVDYNLSRRLNLGPSKLKNARRPGRRHSIPQSE